MPYVRLQLILLDKLIRVEQFALQAAATAHSYRFSRMSSAKNALDKQK